MKLNFESEIPIYIQIAEALEDGVLSGGFPEETQVPSTTELSVAYKINPATVLKGMNLLVEEGVLYKRRGVGMFVQSGAESRIRAKRRQRFYESAVAGLLEEAAKLGISREEVVRLIQEGSIDNGH